MSEPFAIMLEEDLHLLVVDDDAIDRMAVRRALKAAGIRADIAEADTRASAMALLEAHDFDCALLDFQLPDGDGLEVLRQARDAGVATPIVMLTGHGDEQIAVELMKAGAADYLAKSRLTPASLAQCLQTVMRVHKAERQARQAEQARRASEHRLSTTLKSIGDAVIATDTDGCITFMNPVAETLTGWTQAEAVGKDLQEVFIVLNETTRQPVEAPALRVLREGAIVGLANHTILIAKDGSEYPIDDSGAPIWDEEGKLLGVVLVFRDISERKRAEEARMQTHLQITALNQKLLRAMIETHHRVRNSLQFVAAMVDMLAMSSGESISPQELKQIGMHIHTLAVVHSLLTEQAKRDGEARYVSAHEILERLLPILQDMAGPRPLRFDIQEARLTADQGTSLPIIVNELVSNALKYGRNEIGIYLSAEDGKAILEVCDDGPGFPEGFNPKTAAHTGLELVQNLSQWDLKGKVAFENRSEGGACVRVTISLPAEVAAC
ncbi:MAG TPA: response regulator [Chthonomonadaceae bacterium]|nr:response regulator [Chthonomonadaceae bacterium]